TIATCRRCRFIRASGSCWSEPEPSLGSVPGSRPRRPTIFSKMTPTSCACGKLPAKKCWCWTKPTLRGSKTSSAPSTRSEPNFTSVQSRSPVSELTASKISNRDEAFATPKRRHPYLAFATRAGAGLLVIGFLLWHYDARPVLRILAREDLGYFIATIAIYIAGQVMSAWRWQLLAAVGGGRARFRDFLGYYFVGLFTNLFVPGLLGGDALRALYLGRKTHRLGEAVASVVADRGTGLIALFWLAALMALLIPSALAPQVIEAVVLVGAVALAIVLLSPLAAMTLPHLPRLLRRGLGMVHPYLHRPLSMLPGFFLSFLLQASLGLGQWLLARGLGLPQPLAVFLLCVPVANVAAGLPVTLNGLGVRETAYLILFGMAGMARDDAIALGLLWFAATMVGGLSGAIAFALTEFPEKPRLGQEGR